MPAYNYTTFLLSWKRNNNFCFCLKDELFNMLFDMEADEGDMFVGAGYI